MNFKVRQSNGDRSALTRAALVKAARGLFVKNGYSETSTPALVKAAGVTRGALYHHFEDKKSIFRAVIEIECADVAGSIRASASNSPSVMAALRAGATAYLDAMQLPGRAQLVLIEGPAVLGLQAMKKINDNSAGQTLLEGLRSAIDVGEIPPVSASALATLLDAAFDRAALEIASGAARKDIETAIMILLDGLTVTGLQNNPACP